MKDDFSDVECWSPYYIDIRRQFISEHLLKGFFQYSTVLIMSRDFLPSHFFLEVASLEVE